MILLFQSSLEQNSLDRIGVSGVYLCIKQQMLMFKSGEKGNIKDS